MNTGASENYTYGFGVDSSGQVYVGTMRYIGVYKEGELQYKISPVPRGYCFTLKEDRIFVADLSSVWIMDLNGVELSVIEGEDAHSLYCSINTEQFTSQDGTLYTRIDSFRPKIVRADGTVIFEMSDTDYHLKLFLVIESSAFALFLGAFIIVFLLTGEGRKGGTKGVVSYEQI